MQPQPPPRAPDLLSSVLLNISLGIINNSHTELSIFSSKCYFSLTFPISANDDVILLLTFLHPHPTVQQIFPALPPRYVPAGTTMSHHL